MLCGPSGSGKSTLIRCINHIEKHDGGRIVVDGVELSNRMADINSVRCEVGMVFQSFNLFPHLTVAENCMLAPMKVRGISRGGSARSRTGLAAEGPHPGSGGQVSRTIVGWPAATRRHRAGAVHAAEDHAVRRTDVRARPRWSRKCWRPWSSWQRWDDDGLRDARDGISREVADRVVFMDRGSIVEEADPETFFRAPRTERAKGFLNQIIH